MVIMFVQYEREREAVLSGASLFNNQTLSKRSRLSLLGQLHHCFPSGPLAYTFGVSFFFPRVYIIKEVYRDE